MADERTPWEDVLKRAFDANLRYWETVNRAASDYVQSMTRVWKDAPVSWTPGAPRPASSSAPAAPAEASEPRYTPALLLEGPAGQEARAVVMVRNDLDREAEAPVVPSRLVASDGTALELEVRAEPARVRVQPGEQVAVTLAVEMTEELPVGEGVRGEVNVPGLSERGVPVVVRRREAAGSAAAEEKSSAKKEAPKKKASPKKKAASKKAASKKKASPAKKKASSKKATGTKE